MFASKIWTRYAAAVKIVCFERGPIASVGVLAEAGVFDLGSLLPRGDSQAMLTTLIDRFDELSAPIATLCAEGRPYPLSGVAVRASVPAPGKVLCVMRNRPALEEGSSPPWAYLKYADGAVGDRQVLRLAPGEPQLCFEPETAVVIRGPARDVAPDAWRDVVFGSTGLIDVVRHGSMFGGEDIEDWWKSWDTAFAVGPAIATLDEGAHPGRGLRLAVTTASGTVTAEDPGEPPFGEIIAFLSSVMTLHTGDLVACGGHERTVLAACAGSRVRLDLPLSGSLVVEAAA